MEHIRHAPVSDTGAFLQAIAGFAVAVLVTLGIAGSLYHLVAPGGGLSRVFERSLAGGLAAILAMLIFGLCVKLTHNAISAGSRSRYPEFFGYGFAAVGALSAIQLIARGGP